MTHPSSSSTTPTKPASGQTTSPGLWRLVLCSLGICGCYLYYGILQERLFTGDHRLGPTFALVTACLTNVAVALIWRETTHLSLFRRSQQTQRGAGKEDDATQPLSLHHSLFLLTAGCYVGAMTCSNEAIPYVSYPVAVLAKSCKLIPTMIVGQLVEGRLYTRDEWIAALFISSGIVLFHLSRPYGSGSQSDEKSGKRDASTYGMVLLLVSLAMDGLLSSCQNFLKRDNRKVRQPTAVETMLYINLYALFYLVPFSMYSGQWSHGLNLLATLPSVAWSVLVLNLTVGIGQIFIFLTIVWYTPVITTTITTTRKFFTILLSVWTFGHKFTSVQWTAIALVFVGLYFAILMVNKEHSSVTIKAKTA